MKSLVSLDLDGKSSKKLLFETLVLFTEAAEACLQSIWQRMCEELFSALLVGMTQIAVTQGEKLSRNFRVGLGRLVTTACEQVCFKNGIVFVSGIYV